MKTEALKTPVALFVFNRPDTTRRVFDAIASVRPARLLIVADGPRLGKPGEAEVCREVRGIVGRVDWPCEVLTNFADNNLGCQERMISGLNWVFSVVEEAIILEDDCLPDPSFFPFCRDLLERYRDDDRVAYISGCNLLQRYTKIRASYFFSQIGGIWGWATWRSEWERYDRHLKDWQEVKSENLLTEIFDDRKVADRWTRIFDAMYDGTGPNTWDYQWLFTCLKNNALVAVSGVNLISNIGFGIGATHTGQADSRLTPSVSAIEFPLRHPSNLIPMRSLDRRLQHLFVRPFLTRILCKARRVASSLVLHCIRQNRG